MDTATPPPIDPSQVPHQPVKWPKIIAIISITLGTLSLLQCAVGPVSLNFLDTQMQVFIDQGADPDKVENYLEEMGSLTVLSSIGLGIVAVILITGGVFLLLRKRLGPIILQIWAVLKILVGGYFTLRGSSLSRTQMEITMDVTSLGGGQQMEMIQKITEYATYGGLVFGILWLAALPVFFLIWFLREPVRNEIAGW